jgi:hypothetical protein
MLKMWHRILKIERPDAANDQDRIVKKAHKKAELMKKNFENTIQKIQFGEFKVKSSQGDSFYTVSYNEFCENECKQNFGRVCKICVHRYKCECSEYLVKNTMCKHVHMVRMYERERGTNTVLDDVANSITKDCSEINQHHEEKIQQFVKENTPKNEKMQIFKKFRPHHLQDSHWNVSI